MKIEIQEQYIESFKEFLTRKGLRVTNQRMAIFSAAFSCDEHFTAEDLLDKARNLDDSVSVLQYIEPYHCLQKVI